MARTATEKNEVVEKATARLTGKLTIGGMTDKLIELRDKKRDLEAKVKVIETEVDGITEMLIAAADSEGIDKGNGKKGSFSITPTVVATLLDIDKLNAYIKRTGHFQLYTRRISDPAYRELLAMGKKVPGLEPFTKRRLNLRTASAEI